MYFDKGKPHTMRSEKIYKDKNKLMPTSFALPIHVGQVDRVTGLLMATNSH